ncbi:MAG: hypothetical protein FJZ57_02775 [Chlamydiae bacterium]|nr:hypothetical protein [Chlamydiota bacterium]
MHGEEIWEEIDLSSDNDPIPNETNVNKPTTAKIDVIAQNIFSPLHITCSEGLKHEYERSSDELARMVTIDYGSDSDISDISDSSDPYPWSSHIN